jgi:hypothetical protein
MTAIEQLARVVRALQEKSNLKRLRDSIQRQASVDEIAAMAVVLLELWLSAAAEPLDQAPVSFERLREIARLSEEPPATRH